MRPGAIESYTAELDTALASVQERKILISTFPELAVLYDLVVKGTEGDSLHDHRHALDFDPDRPDQMNPKLMEVSKCALDSGSSEPTSQHKSICDG